MTIMINNPVGIRKYNCHTQSNVLASCIQPIIDSNHFLVQIIEVFDSIDSTLNP